MSMDRSHNGGHGWTFAKRLTLRTPQRMYEKRINGFGAVKPAQWEGVQDEHHGGKVEVPDKVP